jgi:hypothetical protein
MQKKSAESSLQSNKQASQGRLAESCLVLAAVSVHEERRDFHKEFTIG